MVSLRGMVLSVFVLMVTCPLFAQQLYITNEPKESLELVNLATKQITTLYDIGAKPDDLTLNSNGQLLYTVPSTGTLNLYDPVAKTNTVLASGLEYARDMEIEPGGNTMLIAIYAPGKIVRYNFTTRAVTTLVPKIGGSCDGIAYDQYGNLYAVAKHNTIIQINPSTGAILNTLVLEPHSGVNGGDGLTYDSYTGTLWATHFGTTGKGLIQIFTNASGFTGTFNLFLFTTELNGSAPDGLKSDGLGNLYVGAINTAFVYNIPSNTITESVAVGGADGVSLVPGTYGSASSAASLRK
jgi:hypothetical protein